MEKQKQVRRTKRIEVRFGVNHPSQLGFTIDVSEAGLFVKTTAIYPAKTLRVLEMRLPDREGFSLRGYVTWAMRIPPALARHLRKAEMGIELINPPQEYLTFVRGLFPALV
ncbi:MAG: pilus assembly protein PilZ [Nitrospirae bacterium]|nr:pilus assembly protein PilZ [Nitrospirota bacterium]